VTVNVFSGARIKEVEKVGGRCEGAGFERQTGRGLAFIFKVKDSYHNFRQPHNYSKW